MIVWQEFLFFGGCSPFHIGVFLLFSFLLSSFLFYSHCIKEVIIFFLPKAWLVCILDMFAEYLFLMLTILTSFVRLSALHVILCKNLHSVLISKMVGKKKLKISRNKAAYGFSLSPFCYETSYFSLPLYVFWLWIL